MQNLRISAVLNIPVIKIVVNVTPSPPPHYLSLLTMSLLTPAGDQLVVRGGNAHFLPPHKNTIEGTEKNRTNEQLGVNQEQRKVLQHYMHVRTIASVGY